MSLWNCCSINAVDVLPRNEVSVHQTDNSVTSRRPHQRYQWSRNQENPSSSSSLPSPRARLDKHFSHEFSSVESLSSRENSDDEQQTSLSMVKFRASTFNNLADSIICFNQTTHEITFINKRAHKMFGLSITVGKHIRLIFPNIELNGLATVEDKVAQAVRNNQFFSVRFSLTAALTQNNERIWIQIIRENNTQGVQHPQSRVHTHIVRSKTFHLSRTTENSSKGLHFLQLHHSREKKEEKQFKGRDSFFSEKRLKPLPSFEQRTRRDRQNGLQSGHSSDGGRTLVTSSSEDQRVYRRDTSRSTHCFAKQQGISRWQILIAEDESVTRKMIVQNMQRLGFQHITSVTDGEALIRAYTGAKIATDLIVTDIEMPNKDGLAAVQEIRKLEKGTKERAFIVICSGKPFQDESNQAGADAFLDKPLPVEILKNLVQKEVAKRKLISEEKAS